MYSTTHFGIGPASQTPWWLFNRRCQRTIFEARIAEPNYRGINRKTPRYPSELRVCGVKKDSRGGNESLIGPAADHGNPLPSSPDWYDNYLSTKSLSPFLSFILSTVLSAGHTFHIQSIFRAIDDVNHDVG